MSRTSVTPTESEIAEGYRVKAEAMENAGYHRLATALRELAERYDRVAEREAAGGVVGE